MWAGIVHYCCARGISRPANELEVFQAVSAMVKISRLDVEQCLNLSYLSSAQHLRAQSQVSYVDWHKSTLQRQCLSGLLQNSD